MIYYFSATGNSRYVAQQVAAAIGDGCQEITYSGSPADSYNKPEALHATAEKDNTNKQETPDKVFGIVVPTHIWGLPAIVQEWIERINFHLPADTYCFLIATYGTTSGQIARQTDKLLRQHTGHGLDASFGVSMPDIWTPIFDLLDKEKVAQRVARAKDETVAVALQVRQRTRGCHIPHPIPTPIAQIGYAFYDSARQTRHFRLTDSCIGCGLCAKQCPVQAIRMVDKRPQWTQKHCTMCLRCLHHCPKFAIQYDHRTAKHGQYTFNKYDKLCQ